MGYWRLHPPPPVQPASPSDQNVLPKTYKTITLTTGEVVVMEVSGIDHYYKCGHPTMIGHHVDLPQLAHVVPVPAGACFQRPGLRIASFQQGGLGDDKGL